MITGLNPNPNPNVVVDLRKKETLNSFSYVHAVRSFTHSQIGLVNRYRLMNMIYTPPSEKKTSQ